MAASKSLQRTWLSRLQRWMPVEMILPLPQRQTERIELFLAERIAHTAEFVVRYARQKGFSI